MKTDLIFDGGSLYARAYYATVANGSLIDHAAVGAATTMVLHLLDLHSGCIPDQATRLLFCWDTGSKTVKNREPKPADYHQELRVFRDLMPVLFGAANAIPPCHEGDDAVATAVYRADPEAKTHQTYIVTGDKDLSSLQSGNVKVYCLNQKMVLSTRQICEKWNVKRPSQVAIALAILGDAGDNVPGIKGWGPKRTKKIFESVPEAATFAEALALVDAQVPESLKDVFYQSLDLTVLDPEVPGVPEPAPLAFGSAKPLAELGLHSTADFFNTIKRQYTGEGASKEEAPNAIDFVEY